MQEGGICLICKKNWGQSNYSEDLEYLMSEFWRRLILMTQERLGKDMDCTLDLFCAKRKETCSFERIGFVTKSFHENREAKTSPHCGVLPLFCYQN